MQPHRRRARRMTPPPEPPGAMEERMAFNFEINGKAAQSDAPPQTPLLWVIREELKLTGTKFGCGTGLCGACMVHIDGKRAFSCQTQVSQVAGKAVTTIEGLRPIPPIPCRGPGSPSGCRNAATASPARS